MNVLITGANGFLGRHLRAHYEPLHSVYSPSSSELDFSSQEQVNNFFNKNKIDVGLHTAIKGGKRNDADKVEDFFTNLQMYVNLKKHTSDIKLLINFCSGAAFDRQVDICSASEDLICERNPTDFYGLAKNIIARDIQQTNKNIINLRLFGCFSADENDNRYIKSNLLRSINNDEFLIHQNKYMDFFWVEDLLKVVDHMIHRTPCEIKDYNLCYEEKYTLLDIIKKIKNLTNSKQDVIIENKNLGSSYTGSSSRITKLGLQFEGIDCAISAMYASLLAQR